MRRFAGPIWCKCRLKLSWPKLGEQSTTNLGFTNLLQDQSSLGLELPLQPAPAARGPGGASVARPRPGLRERESL